MLRYWFCKYDFDHIFQIIEKAGKIFKRKEETKSPYQTVTAIDEFQMLTSLNLMNQKIYDFG